MQRNLLAQSVRSHPVLEGSVEGQEEEAMQDKDKKEKQKEGEGKEGEEMDGGEQRRRCQGETSGPRRGISEGQEAEEEEM